MNRPRLSLLGLMEFQSPVLGYERPLTGEAMAVIPNFQGGHTLVSFAGVQVCNLVSSLLAACIGSLLARWLDTSRRRSSPNDGGHRAPPSGEGVPDSPASTTA